MARIKIKDLPKDMKISSEEMKRVKGGIDLMTSALTSPTDYIKIETAVDGKIASNVIDHKISVFDNKLF